MVLQDAIDDLVKLIGIFGPMYDATVFFGFGGKLVEIFVKVRDGVTLDGASLLTQLFPLHQSVCHIVTFRTYCPESGIVPL
jgi:hypothetical protein